MQSEFALIIPQDWKTSTPIASRKRKISPDWGAEAVSSVKHLLHGITVLGSKQRPLIEVHSCPWPRVEQDSPEGKTSQVGKEGSSELGEAIYPPDPIFDFFGI